MSQETNPNTTLINSDIADASAADQTFEMPTAFDPHPVEAAWYPAWRQAGYFAPRAEKPGEKAPRFVVTIPPPNVTGVLHLGHALQHSIHDCLVRFHRMRGDITLCIPGTDHASISTQIKVADALREETGQSRHDIGREAFIERAYAWKEVYGNAIIDQMQRLGCSYDWDRLRFTLDEGYVRAVLTVFKKWFDEERIYRGHRLVNWSVGAQTTVSDLEIEFREVAGKLWHFRYPVENSDEYIVVATTRPETMLGDTAVAVHPDDERYTHFIGKNVILPLMNRPIPVIADSYVDKEFGTGAVKITPAHDPNDYEMGQRHDLEKITVIGFDAKITAAGGKYEGLTREDARRAVVKDLQALDLVEKIDEYTHSVGHCARTGTVIEPLLSDQWFVAMKELARPVADAIRMNRVRYQPERFGLTSLDWQDNIRDWNISRQLWWGHRVPVYYGPNGEVKCSVEPITEPGWTQDEDVLDTWFSSALWPFAVLGWPDNLETEFYPTSVLITGRDILNLWVSRMILTSLDLLDGQIPFHDVLVHPTVQDCFGLRMSKSLGTGIDPMALIETYGADATRFGLLQLATGAQDVRFIDNAEVQLGETEVRRRLKNKKPLDLSWDGKPSERYPQMQSARSFANKIWNAARFVLSAGTVEVDASGAVPQPADLASRWILARLDTTVDDVTAKIEAYDFEGAASALYTFIWGDFCDWFVELSKPHLRAGDTARIQLLTYVLDVSLRLLHPFMPFLSEEIWQRLPIQREAESLCIAAWPERSGADHGAVEAEFGLIQEAVRVARNLHKESRLPHGQKVPFVLVTENGARGTLEAAHGYFQQLANAESVDFATEAPENALAAAIPGVQIFLPLAGLVDTEREGARLNKERDEKLKDLERVTGKLSNEKFTSRAPADVIAKEEAKKAELETAVANLDARLAAL